MSDTALESDDEAPREGGSSIDYDPHRYNGD